MNERIAGVKVAEDLFHDIGIMKFKVRFIVHLMR